MKIFFDHQTFTEQNYGGISRYFSELITGINKTINNQAYVSSLFSNNIHLQESGIKVKSFLAKRNIRGKQKIIYETNRLFSIAKLHEKPYDIFHATYYDPYFIPHLKGHPLVVTFLDMIHEKFSSQFPELFDGGLITKNKRLLANRADRIIAISENTKRDIVELLDIDSAKIDVVYLGNSLKISEHILPNRQDSNRYFLFVGRRERYKNFEGLLRAIHPLLKKYRIKLVCAGGGSFTDDERLLIRSVSAGELVEQCAIDDLKLQGLYRNAIAFIFPTLYEGFGIPVLEAFACDCPCIVSNLSSLPEVAGDAALYIDPTSPDSIMAAVEKLLYDSKLRQVLIEKGRVQLARFSWQSTTNETIRVYQSIK